MILSYINRKCCNFEIAMISMTDNAIGTLHAKVWHYNVCVELLKFLAVPWTLLVCEQCCNTSWQSHQL